MWCSTVCLFLHFTVTFYSNIFSLSLLSAFFVKYPQFMCFHHSNSPNILNLCASITATVQISSINVLPSQQHYKYPQFMCFHHSNSPNILNLCASITATVQISHQNKISKYYLENRRHRLNPKKKDKLCFLAGG